MTALMKIGVPMPEIDQMNGNIHMLAPKLRNFQI